MRAKQNSKQALLLSIGLLFAPFLWAQSAAPLNVPESLQPLSGEILIFSFIGQGNQIYVCQKVDGAYAWKLKGPDAKLSNAKGEVVGRHFAGPTWEGKDGSRVTGKLLASVPSPDKQSVAWLLLTAAAHEGTGTMTRVQSIQRLETNGGMAPTIRCGQGNGSEQVSVPYQAQYNFYGMP